MAAGSVGIHRRLARGARPCPQTKLHTWMKQRHDTETPWRSEADQTLRPTLILSRYIRLSTFRSQGACLPHFATLSGSTWQPEGPLK